MTRVLALAGRAGVSEGASGAQRMAARSVAALRDRGLDARLVTEPPAGSPPGDAAAGPGTWVPDLVHVYDLAAAAYCRRALRLSGKWDVPLVSTPASAPEVWEDPAVAEQVLRGSGATFVLTAGEAGALTNWGGSAERCITIPQAPDARPGRPGVLRRRLGVGGPIVLFLGRRIPTKGIQLLGEAAPLVWSAIPTCTFVVAGPGRAIVDRPADRRWVDLGSLDETDKADALEDSSLLCLPSRAEIFPLVFAEAWGAARPVVSGAFDGAREVVRDGVDGLVVDLDPRSVSAGIIRLLRDDRLRRSLGRNGHVRVRDGMSWERVAEVLGHAYGSVLQGAAGQVPSR